MLSSYCKFFWVQLRKVFQLASFTDLLLAHRVISFPRQWDAIIELNCSKFSHVRFGKDLTLVYTVYSYLQSKQKSEPRVITHGDELTLGNTTLHLHIHPGSQTCDSCEPGQVQAQAQGQTPIQQGTSVDLDDEGTVLVFKYVRALRFTIMADC